MILMHLVNVPGSMSVTFTKINWFVGLQYGVKMSSILESH